VSQKGVELVTPRDRNSGRNTGRTASPPRAGRVPGARTGSAVLQERLTGVIEPVARRAGLDLERVAVSRVGRRHQVQVIVDRDGGVGLDTIAEVSRAVSAALDAADAGGPEVVPGEYVLEVSSPGVDRPLTEPRHWRRSVGRLVTVPVAGDGRRTGRVVAAAASGVTLEVDGVPRELGYGQLGPGRVQVELRRLEEASEESSREEGEREH
jgi:ribosome maturation factor RimP